MKARNWFFYSKIFNPAELLQGMFRICLSYIGKHYNGMLPQLRNKFKKCRYNFTIDKIRWLEGTDIFVYTGSSMYEAVLRRDGFDREEFSFLKQNLRKGDVFIDVGANIGFYTVFAARLVGKEGNVISFEPSKRDFELLQKNLAHNKFSNVVSFKIALSNYNGKGKFLISGGNATDVSTLSDSFYNDKVKVETIEDVEVKTLDCIVDNYDIKKINIIKVDAEGHDLFVLEGARNSIRKFKPIILVEVSSQNLKNAGHSIEDLISIFGSLNYQIYYFVDNNRLVKSPPEYTINPKNSYFNIVCYPK